jgi:TPR repeat protein
MPPAATRRAWIDAADEVEAGYRRMHALQRMTAVELRRLLSGDPARAAPWVETAARYGSIEAELRFAQMLLDGVGVAKDEGAAFRWFMHAAERGAAEAMNMVGRCYENGWGAAQDLGEAARWYRRSAEADYDWGEYNYANMLFDGRGLQRDLIEAVRWYRRAAARGHARAMNLLARCCEEGWGVARDEDEAFRWYRLSAEGGYFRGEFNYGSMLAKQGRIDEALPRFDQALRAASGEGRTSLVAVLQRHADRRVRALGQRLAENPA